MENNREKYGIANLSQEEIKRLNNLEKTISELKGEEVILVAYKDQKNN